MGNPGVGKSTLLNGILGEAKFKAGINIGSGLTSALQWETGLYGIHFADTPGLADIKSREQAAEEITNALKTDNDDHKLVFVVTLSNGRVSPQDVATIKTTLNALSQLEGEIPYGIIANQISKGVMKRLKENKDDYNKLLVNLSTDSFSSHHKSFIHLYPKKDELEDEENAVHQITDELQHFLQALPSVKIEPDQVVNLNPNEFDTLKKKFEEEISILYQQKDLMEKKMAKMAKDNEQRIKLLEDNLTRGTSSSSTSFFEAGISILPTIANCINAFQANSVQADAGQGTATEDKDVLVGKIWGNHQASKVIRCFLDNNPEVEREGWKWNGQWITKEDGSSYAGMSREKHN
jgi:hypothetical protein